MIFVGEELHYFREKLYNHLGKLFKLARKTVHHLNTLTYSYNRKESCSSFKYLGLFLQQKGDSIKIDQNSYCKSLEPIEISKERCNKKSYPLVKKNWQRKKK